MKRKRVRDWVEATRILAFPPSVVQMAVMAAALGWRHGGCDWINIALSVLVLVCLHVGTNILGDCRDHETGVDFPGAPNDVTWIQDGRFAVRELRMFAASFVAVGVALGLVVAMRSSWSVLLIGAAGVVLALGYPRLKYHALGDVAVFLAFTVLPAVGIGIVALGRFLPETLLVALPPGLVTVAILNANNIRDVESDARAGCRTLPMVVGVDAAKWMYYMEVAVAYALLPVLVVAGLAPYASAIVFLTAPFAVRNILAMRRGEVSGLVVPSAMLQLAFGALFAVSFLVAF